MVACNPPAKGLTGFFFLFVIIFCWFGWILFLAGLARSNDLCADKKYGPGAGIGGTSVGMFNMRDRRLLGRDLLGKGEDCAADMALAWWACFFDFFVLIMITCLYLGVGFAKKVESGVKLLMAMVTVLVMVVGHPYVNLAYHLNENDVRDAGGYAEDIVDAVNVVTAGVVVLTTFNCIWILIHDMLVYGGSSGSSHAERVSPMPK